MKNIYTYILIVLTLLSLASCKDDYVTDGGVSKAETPLTVYDYLDQHKYQMFDTVLQLVDKLELKDVINSSGTFFAPNDYNVQNYLDAMSDTLREQTDVADTTYTLANLLDDITEEMLLQYALADTVTLAGAAISGETYATLANTDVVVKRTLTTESQYYTYSSEPVYFLYYCKPEMEEERCQTTGILTQNGEGTILHALNSQHVFGQFTKEVED